MRIISSGVRSTSPPHLYDQDIAQVETQHCGIALDGIKGYDVAVGYTRASFQGYGVFVAMVACDEETAFLSRPLVEIEVLDMHVLDLGGPFRLVDVANDFGNDFHNMMYGGY